MARDHGISASGTLAAVALPTEGAAQADGVFAEAVADAFAHAHGAGIADPILIGAIPFDQAEPACLHVPRWYQRLGRAALATIARAEPPAHRLAEAPVSSPDRTAFEQGVARTVAAIRAGEADKVVLSRVSRLTFDRPVDPGWLMHRLIEQNPAGFHFRVPLPDGATLVGASPEMLVRRAGAQVQTCPLAGSARRVADPCDDARVARGLLESDKDRREHAHVVDFLREVLTPLCETIAIPARPEVLATGTMWHLATAITGRLRTPGPSVLQLACALHPTPALCGTPRAAARRLIARCEPFSRGMFAGIVGWCDSRGDGEWAVAIRCGIVRDRAVQLFAGAGIVDGSGPAAEWHETEAKLRTMRRALGVEA
ncbi:isochorismate synthase [Sphingomonas sp. RHCKR7]|uniref:isochorismate synthase n=1 Tax=Sphingomonas folli TaxID=2862497 RepID=UPI001CA586A7|nr:isochorismate synthase [Sphingomonas folli]MBW6528625.1 isochorismate synthase [Sphingomonas folli]